MRPGDAVHEGQAEAVAALAGGEPSTTAYAFFPLGAAMLLMSTQRYWKRPVAVEE